ncbi:pyruvate carboxylase subunit B, partial [Gilvimarinus sp. 1_MG-2023]|nr:pyruvate carboxylase subunit B [Gilvimarinus sp. 1_MG-2023]
DVDSKSKMGVATEFVIDVHGESYDIAVTGVGDFGAGKRKIYLSMDGVPQEVIFEPLNEYVDDGASKGRKRATEPGHVTATMPGNV